VLYKSGVYAWKVLCLTPGDRHAVLRKKLSEEESELIGMQKSATGNCDAICGNNGDAAVTKSSGAVVWTKNWHGTHANPPTVLGA
jgi:hypothetical protein